MTTQKITPDVRFMAEGNPFIIAALIRVSARINFLATVSKRAATNRANKATRCDATSHSLLSMQHPFNVGNFNSTTFNQKDVDTIVIDVFLACRRYIKSLQQHTMPNENGTGMRQVISRQQHLEIQFNNLFRGHSRRFYETGLHVPETGRLTVSHRPNTVTYHC